MVSFQFGLVMCGNFNCFVLQETAWKSFCDVHENLKLIILCNQNIFLKKLTLFCVDLDNQ